MTGALLFLLLLAALAAGAILGTIDAVRRDGYGPRPDRSGRFEHPERFL